MNSQTMNNKIKRPPDLHLNSTITSTASPETSSSGN